MSPYLSHLLSDLEAIITDRWRACPPHFWQAGIPDPYLAPPAGADLPGFSNLEGLGPRDPEASLAEAERFVEHEPLITMFDHFGLRPEEFPPAEQLTDEQLDELVFAIRRLWAAFNFTAVVPSVAPARIVYPLLLQRMTRPAMVMNFGHVGIEFCQYEPAECPFGTEWCECKQYAPAT